MSKEHRPDQERWEDLDTGYGLLEPAPSPGVLLREERVRQGLSREEIAETTRLRPETVKALEEEAWEALPAMVFVKGFLRTYARALGIDIGESIDRLEDGEPMEMSTLKPLIEMRRPIRWPKAIAWLLPIALAAGAYWWWSRTPSVTVPSPVIETAEPPIAQIPDSLAPGGDDAGLSLETGPLVAAPAAEVPGIPGEADEEEVPPAREEPAALTPQEERPFPQPESPVRASVHEKHLLRAVVTEKTWLRLTVDNREPREYLLKPGSRIEWEADGGFLLVVGNAAGVDLEFDGTALKDLGKKGEVITLSLPEGFRPIKDEE